MRIPRLVWALMLLGSALALWVALVPLEGVPHLSDELSYTLQARLFASGSRVGPPADNPTMLQYPFWQTTPHSFSVFPPGWPLLLTAGVLIGAPWLVNPLVFALAPLLTWALACELTSRRAASLAASIMALSPGALILAGSRMAHTSTMVALLLAAVVVTRRRDGAAAWWAAGLALAYVVTARPFDGLVLGGPLILAGLLRAPDLGRRLPLLALPGLAAAWILLDNRMLTGDPFTFPVNPWFDAWVADQGVPPGCNRLGFGAGTGCHPTAGDWDGHTPAKALTLAWDSVKRLDRLFLGVHGGLLVAAAGAALLARRAWPLVAFMALNIGAYMLYWSPGMAYGARFWHACYLALPLFTAVALDRLFRKYAWLALGLPLAAAPRYAGELADRYWCADAALRDTLRSLDITEGVLFVQAHGERVTSWPALGVPDFLCTPMVESVDAFMLLDPTSPQGGLQPRHALPDMESTRLYMDMFHPEGTEAWLARHDLARDEWLILKLEDDVTSPDR